MVLGRATACGALAAAMFASLLVASPAKAAVTSTVISNATYPLGLDVDPDGNVWIGYADGSMTPKGVTVVPAASGSLFRVAVTAGVESLIFNLDGVQGILRAPSGHLFVSAGGNLYVATATNTTVFGVATTANTLTQLSSSGGVRVGGRRANPPTPFAHWLRSHPVPPQMWW